MPYAETLRLWTHHRRRVSAYGQSRGDNHKYQYQAKGERFVNKRRHIAGVYPCLLSQRAFTKKITMRTALILFFCLPLFCAGQSDFSPQPNPGPGLEKRIDFSIGYNFHFGKKDENDHTSQKFHFLEAGIWRSKYYSYRHNGGWVYYVTSEIGLNTKKLVIGPKIGCFLAWGPFVVGNDLTVYTDFSESTLRWIPYFGLGSNRIKLTINPHFVLTNKHFLESRFPPGHLNLSYALINLHRKNT